AGSLVFASYLLQKSFQKNLCCTFLWQFQARHHGRKYSRRLRALPANNLADPIGKQKAGRVKSAALPVAIYLPGRVPTAMTPREATQKRYGQTGAEAVAVKEGLK